MIHLLLTKSLQTYKDCHAKMLHLLKNTSGSSSLEPVQQPENFLLQQCFLGQIYSLNMSSEKVILYIKRHSLKPIISFKGSLFFLVKKYGCLYSPDPDHNAEPRKNRSPNIGPLEKQIQNIEQALNKKQTRFIVNRQFRHIEFEKNSNSEIKNP